ncbi:hypothetical protein CR513_00494, partial [Mucuna pruriens]
MSSLNQEPTPKCNSRLEVSHYHFPPKQSSQEEGRNQHLDKTGPRVCAKFFKELCIHKRKKLKGGVETGGIVSALTKHEDVTTGLQ